MKIILNRDIKSLGKVGSIVTVKNGYGRNFLLPKKYATMATKENIAKLEQKLDELKARNNELIDKAKQVADLLDNTVFNTVRQASDDDTIYGSIRTKDIYGFIINLLKNKNFNFPFDICGIKIAEPIKILGQYVISIEIYSDIVSNLRLNVCRTTADFEEDVASFDRKKEKALTLEKKKDANDKKQQNSEKQDISINNNVTDSNSKENDKKNEIKKEEVEDDTNEKKKKKQQKKVSDKKEKESATDDNKENKKEKVAKKIDKKSEKTKESDKIKSKKKTK